MGGGNGCVACGADDVDVVELSGACADVACAVAVSCCSVLCGCCVGLGAVVVITVWLAGVLSVVGADGLLLGLMTFV